MIKIKSKQLFMNKIFYKTNKCQTGFTLAEILAALVIGAMVLVSTLGIYNRLQSSINSIRRKIDSSRLPRQILQRIAEDIDRVIAPGADTKINVESKYDPSGYSTARLEIIRTYYDDKNTLQNFERIIWVTDYDFDSDSNGLVLYRGHSGIVDEDKLLEEKKEDLQKELLVPLCQGITYFRIQIPKGEELLDRSGDSIPGGIVVTISFAEPFVDEEAVFNVLDEEKFSRIITIDRTRQIKFEVSIPDPNEETDPNESSEESREETKKELQKMMDELLKE
jgi:prepilin-type N-terminal cleavage/methylation domain-containing protein